MTWVGWNLIGRSICVGNRSGSFVSVPHTGVDVAIPVGHLSLSVFSPVLELSVKDVSVPMAHYTLPLEPAESCHELNSSPAIDEVSFVLVQGAIEEDAFTIEFSSVKKTLISVNKVTLNQKFKSN